VYTNVYFKGKCDTIWENALAPWDDPIWQIDDKRVELKISIYRGSITEYGSGKIWLNGGSIVVLPTIFAINFHLNVLE